MHFYGQADYSQLAPNGLRRRKHYRAHNRPPGVEQIKDHGGMAANPWSIKLEKTPVGGYDGDG
jgi:hypothetical protein